MLNAAWRSELTAAKLIAGTIEPRLQQEARNILAKQPVCRDVISEEQMKILDGLYGGNVNFIADASRMTDHAVPKFVTEQDILELLKVTKKYDILLVGTRLKEMERFIEKSPKRNVYGVWGLKGGRDEMRFHEDELFVTKLVTKKRVYVGGDPAKGLLYDPSNLAFDFDNMFRGIPTKCFTEDQWRANPQKVDIVIFIHSLYDITPQEAADYISMSHASKAYVVMIMAPELRFTQTVPNGKLQIVWEKTSFYSTNAKLTIGFHEVRLYSVNASDMSHKMRQKAVMKYSTGNSNGYEHSYKNFVAWNWHTVFSLKKGMLATEIIRNTAGCVIMTLDLIKSSFFAIRQQPLLSSSMIRLPRPKRLVKDNVEEFFWIDKEKFNRLVSYGMRSPIESFEATKFAAMADGIKSSIVVGPHTFELAWNVTQKDWVDCIGIAILYSALCRKELFDVLSMSVKIAKTGKQHWDVYYKFKRLWDWITVAKRHDYRTRLEKIIQFCPVYVWDKASGKDCKEVTFADYCASARPIYPYVSEPGTPISSVESTPTPTRPVTPELPAPSAPPMSPGSTEPPSVDGDSMIESDGDDEESGSEEGSDMSGYDYSEDSSDGDEESSDEESAESGSDVSVASAAGSVVEDISTRTKTVFELEVDLAVAKAKSLQDLGKMKVKAPVFIPKLVPLQVESVASRYMDFALRGDMMRMQTFLRYSTDKADPVGGQMVECFKNGIARHYNDKLITANLRILWNQRLATPLRPKGGVITAMLPEREFGNMLDFGCGDGSTTANIANRLHIKPEFRFACDVRPCKNADILNFSQVNGNSALPFASSSMDVTFALMALHHCADAQGRVAELCRVTDKKGVILIREHNVMSIREKVTVDFAHYIYDQVLDPTPDMPEVTTYYPLASWDAYFRACGFKPRDNAYRWDAHLNPQKVFYRVYEGPEFDDFSEELESLLEMEEEGEPDKPDVPDADPKPANLKKRSSPSSSQKTSPSSRPRMVHDVKSLIVENPSVVSEPCDTFSKIATKYSVEEGRMLREAWIYRDRAAYKYCMSELDKQAKGDFRIKYEFYIECMQNFKSQSTIFAHLPANEYATLMLAVNDKMKVLLNQMLDKKTLHSVKTEFRNYAFGGGKTKAALDSFRNGIDLYVCGTSEQLTDFLSDHRKKYGNCKEVSACTYHKPFSQIKLHKYENIYYEEGIMHPIEYYCVMFTMAPNATHIIQGDIQQTGYRDTDGVLPAGHATTNFRWFWKTMKESTATYRCGRNLCRYMTTCLGYDVICKKLGADTKVTLCDPESAPKADINLVFSDLTKTEVMPIIEARDLGHLCTVRSGQGKSKASANLWIAPRDMIMWRTYDLRVVALTRGADYLNLVSMDPAVRRQLKETMGFIINTEMHGAKLTVPYPNIVKMVEKFEAKPSRSVPLDGQFDPALLEAAIGTSPVDNVRASMFFRTINPPSDVMRIDKNKYQEQNGKVRSEQALSATKYGKSQRSYDIQYAVHTAIERNTTTKNVRSVLEGRPKITLLEFDKVVKGCMKEVFNLDSLREKMHQKILDQAKKYAGNRKLPVLNEDIANVFKFVIDEFMKQQDKIKGGPDAAFKNKAGQPVTGWNTFLNLVFGTFFREAEEMLIAHLKDKYVFANGMSDEALQEAINLVMPVNDSHPFMSDQPEYDASQQERTQQVERWFLEKLTGNSNLLNLYYAAREKMRVRGVGYSYTSKWRKTSGEPATLFTNTLLLLFVNLALVGGDENVLCMVIKGDDTLAWLKELKVQFELYDKILVFKPTVPASALPEFCGMLYFKGHLFYNPLKLAQKLNSKPFGKSGDVTVDAKRLNFKQYQQAIHDKLKPFRDGPTEDLLAMTASYNRLSFKQAELLVEQLVGFTNIKSFASFEKYLQENLRY